MRPETAKRGNRYRLKGILMGNDESFEMRPGEGGLWRTRIPVPVCSALRIAPLQPRLGLGSVQNRGVAVDRRGKWGLFDGCALQPIAESLRVMVTRNETRDSRRRRRAEQDQKQRLRCSEEISLGGEAAQSPSQTNCPFHGRDFN